jgi:2'-phosphotransferase
MHLEMVKFISGMNKNFPMRSVDKVAISKQFSKILRHTASEIPELSIRADGYVELKSILALPFFVQNNVDERFVRAMVEADSKTRFSLLQKGNRLYIRANQGHSERVARGIDTDSLHEFIESADEIPKVVHGTNLGAWEHIKHEGLKRMSRSHIHFAPGILGDEGVRSGMRASAYIHIYVNAAKAMSEGIRFYRSANNVILSDGIDGVIDPRYFSRVVDSRSGTVLFSRD